MIDFYTHRPFLIRELNKLTTKDIVNILELGTGDGSSLVLNEFAKCHDNFHINGFETDFNWYSSMKEKYEIDNYKIHYISDWHTFLNTYEFLDKYDLVFVDQSPWEARMNSIEKLKNSVEKIILHDYDYFNKGVISDIYSVDENSVFGKYQRLFTLENNFDVLPPTLVFHKKMNHFYKNIYGWFDFNDIYEKMVRICPNNAHFVEIGSWEGCSSSFMAVEIFNSGKSIKFDCIDTWEGSIEHINFDEIKNKSLYDTFIKNMKQVSGIYTPIRMTSVEGSKLYKDESLDFVFIDASHEYIDIKNDIISWLPKIKPGGYLGGHDIYFDGVNKAVNELLPNVDISLNSWLFYKK